MTTGTTVNYNDTRNEIILDALILLGVYGADDSLSANDVTLAARMLNRLVKAWEGSGSHVWTDGVARIWLQNSQNTYSLASETSDAHWASTYVETELTAALADNDTAVTVTDTTGMTVADKIGIVMSNDYIHWTTIATIPTGTTLTLTTGVTETCSIGDYVYTYTSRAKRPVHVYSANIVSGMGTEESERTINNISFREYHDMSSKKAEGSPIQWNYRFGTSSGTLVVWQTPTDVSERISINYQRPLFDFDSSADTPDIPQEWLEALIYNLAVRLAPAYGKSSELSVLKPMADEMFRLADSHDQDGLSVFFQPSRDRY